MKKFFLSAVALLMAGAASAATYDCQVTSQKKMSDPLTVDRYNITVNDDGRSAGEDFGSVKIVPQGRGNYIQVTMTIYSDKGRSSVAGIFAASQLHFALQSITEQRSFTELFCKKK